MISDGSLIIIRSNYIHVKIDLYGRVWEREEARNVVLFFSPQRRSENNCPLWLPGWWLMLSVTAIHCLFMVMLMLIECRKEKLVQIFYQHSTNGRIMRSHLLDVLRELSLRISESQFDKLWAKYVQAQMFSASCCNFAFAAWREICARSIIILYVQVWQASHRCSGRVNPIDRVDDFCRYQPAICPTRWRCW